MENEELLVLLVLLSLLFLLILIMVFEYKTTVLENKIDSLKKSSEELKSQGKITFIDNTINNERGHGNERNLMVPTGNQEFVWINEDSSTVKGFVTQIQDCPNYISTTKISTPNELTNMKIYGCDALINGKWVQNLTWAECERLRGMNR